MPQDETIASLIASGYLKSKRVIDAMLAVRREDFVLPEMRQYAWADHPLPIGFGQTISAPHMYAFMLEAAQIREGDRILEIGTGSGYGAALLSFLVGSTGKIHSIELIPQLADFARSNLKKADLEAEIIMGDGWHGYPAAAPYDRILVTAACGEIPAPLVAQLREGGRMLVPVGGLLQELLLVEKVRSEAKITPMLPVQFVPLLRDSERRH